MNTQTLIPSLRSSLLLSMLWLLLGTGPEQRILAHDVDCPDWSRTFFLFDTTGGSRCHDLLSFDIVSEGIIHYNTLYNQQDGFLQDWMDLPPLPRERFYHTASEAGLIAEAFVALPHHEENVQMGVNLMVQAHLPTVLDSAVRLDETILTIEIGPQERDEQKRGESSGFRQWRVTKGELIGTSSMPLMMYRTPTHHMELPLEEGVGNDYRIRLYWSGTESVAVRSLRIFGDTPREEQP